MLNEKVSIKLLLYRLTNYEICSIDFIIILVVKTEENGDIFVDR